MAEVIIDSEVIASAAARMGMSEAQIRAWFRATYPTIRAVRLYIRQQRTTEPQYIEAHAVEGQTLDPATVAQILILLEEGGLIERMTDV